MEKFMYLFIHLILPLVLGIDFVWRKSKTKISIVVKLGLYVAILYFLYIWGQWPLVGSYYLRYFMIIIILIITFIAVVRLRSIDRTKPSGIWNYVKVGLTGLMALLIIIVDISASNDKDFPDEVVELNFPLKGGEYYISSGGTNKWVNNHMRDYPNAQQFALDVNKLNKYKSVSKGFLTSKNTDHYIFADTVYCPCNGEVVKIKSNVKDNLSGSMNVKREDGTGNFVKLNCKDVIIFMPHFKQNSVFVSPGTWVKEGTPLGLVGISGFSQEPHLHIQASKYNLDSTLIGIPIKFKGKYLVRNDLFIN